MEKSRWLPRSSGKTAVVLLVTLAGAMATLSVWAKGLPGPVVNADWLEANSKAVVILDVRADVDSFSKRSKGRSPVNPCGAGIKGKGPTVVAGHIPGAVLVRWSLVTAQKKVQGRKLDGWLPEQSDFQRLMQRSGVNGDSLVVITSKGEKAVHAAMAARLYLTLKYYGHEQIALLDGGTAAWLQTGRKVEFGRSRARKGNFKAGPGKTEWIAGLDDVKALSQNRDGAEQLLDNREAAAYLGLARGLDKVEEKWKGHIPGAKSFPLSYSVNTMGPSATLFPVGTVRQVADLTGIDLSRPTTVYCNSGVMASMGWFMLREVLGNENVRLYDGSMQDWAANKKPVAAMKSE